MLVLSRMKNEEVVITVAGYRVVVSIAGVRGNKVRLGFVAPPEVRINRSEVQDDIDKAKAGVSGEHK